MEEVKTREENLGAGWGGVVEEADLEACVSVTSHVASSLSLAEADEGAPGSRP